jgi:hypothetical protein
MRKMRIVILSLATCLCAISDDGLWLLNKFPKEQVEKKYGVKVTDVFLRNMQLASVRFNNGGSGSFVSPQGLLFTNHHVGMDCIQKLSDAKHDYVNNGFYAATLDQEKACPDLEVNVLLKIEDVTSKVNEGIRPDTPSAEANQTRKATMSRLEKECNSATHNRCDVVTLYSGGEYHMYQYKKYTDIRLAFAPEFQAGFFGGDPDNFTYPRYNLDIAFFRAYENGKPVQVDHYFPWSKTGVQDGELTFVPGHPGTTGRLSTMAALEFFRDVSFPFVHRRLNSLIKALEEYSAKSPENARVAQDNLFGQQNSYKAYTGFLAGLRDASLMGRKRDEERRLRAAVTDARLDDKYGKTWSEVAAAYKEHEKFFKPWWLLETNAARGSSLLEIARHVVRYAEEKPKPSEKRLREYTDSGLESLEQEMYTTAPITDSMEIAVLTDYFKFLQSELGANDPTVKQILGKLTPQQAAEHYVSSSKLKDVAERKRLAASVEEVKKSSDGMIRLALILDEPARRLRKQYEDRVEAVLNSSASKIAQARFHVLGSDQYPDATFTLRVTYGDVRGYKNTDGKAVPYATNFAGLYARATGKPPFQLAPSWLKAKSRINMKTPFNFVTTTDTHGGNSGSPTLNTKGEIVGILFDGNIEGLPNRFVFTDEIARSVHVASQGIIEALRVVYRADRLLNELRAQQGSAHASARP